jgi:hypothetical protein
MKPKFIQLTEDQIDTLKSMINLEVHDADEDVEDQTAHIENLSMISLALSTPAMTPEGMAQEIHQLKNKVQGLEMELELFKRGAK